MEHDEARNVLREVDRAAVAPYVDHPPTPAWYPPAVGSWCAALVSCWILDGPAFAIAMVSLLIVQIVFVRWVSRRHGALPDPTRGNPPPEIARQYRLFFTGAALVAVLVLALAWTLGPVVAAPVTLVLVTAGLWRYEHTYAAAAAQVRARLS